MRIEKKVFDQIPEDFDLEAYLEMNPDVAEAGVDPEDHYLQFGKTENRIYKRIAGRPSNLDEQLHINPLTQRPKFIDHEKIWNWIGENFNKSGIRVLEIGSRAVVSDSLWKKVLNKTEYIGFDVLPGKNVDVVGDAHVLSEYFEAGSFDLVMSFAVMEHIAAPWVLAEEISKVLSLGGTTVHETHFSYSEHELPWHFFQYNSRALEVLFCEELGFQTIDLGLSTPLVGRFSKSAPPYLRGKLVRDLYCHSAIASKKIKPIQSADGFSWRPTAKRIFLSSSYPGSQGGSGADLQLDDEL